MKLQGVISSFRDLQKQRKVHLGLTIPTNICEALARLGYHYRMHTLQIVFYILHYIIKLLHITTSNLEMVIYSDLVVPY